MSNKPLMFNKIKILKPITILKINSKVKTIIKSNSTSKLSIIKSVLQLKITIRINKQQLEQLIF